MKPLLNTLYVTSPDSYAALEGENVVIKKDDHTTFQLPLHNLENIYCFGYSGASPALMRACADRNIGLCFFTPNGNFQARIVGKVKGNVLLRKKQYQVSENDVESVKIAASFLLGKISNCRRVIERALRDHSVLLNVVDLKKASESLKSNLKAIEECATLTDLMGFEGTSAKTYFGIFNQLILQQKEDFVFTERSRRPPLDRINCLLSFLYTLLTNDTISAIESTGLDAYVGFMHQDHPGRPSLALDMIEELRPVMADRLALNLINLKQIDAQGFIQKESGGIILTDETKKTVLAAWQERKKESIIHPFLKEKIPFGLIPYVQALLLSRYLRGDLDAYPPFFWK